MGIYFVAKYLRRSNFLDYLEDPFNNLPLEKNKWEAQEKREYE